MTRRRRRVRIRWGVPAVVLAAGQFLAGCDPELAPLEIPQPVEAFVKDYVALGDGFTAGMQSGALSKRLQLDSYPAQLGVAFRMASDLSGMMSQPLVANPGYGSIQGLRAEGYLVLQSLSPLKLTRVAWPDPSLLEIERDTLHVRMELSYDWPYAFRNLGIPGAYARDLLAATDSTNCLGCSADRGKFLFNTVLRPREILDIDNNPLTAVEQALRSTPSLVTVWTGMAEILAAARAGEPDSLPYDSGEFGFWLAGILDALAESSGIRLAAANLPSLATMPFFRVLPPYLVDADFEPVPHPATGERIPLLGVDGTRASDLQPGATVLDSDTRVLLDAWGLLDQGYGHPDTVLILRTMDETGMSWEDAVDELPFLYPHHGEMLPDSMTLTVGEFLVIEAAVDAYNAAIADTCAARGVPVADMRAVFASSAGAGQMYGDVWFTDAYPTGGFFSLDGIYPSSLGYSIIANEWIDVINRAYGAGVGPVNIRRVIVP